MNKLLICIYSIGSYADYSYRVHNRHYYYYFSTLCLYENEALKIRDIIATPVNIYINLTFGADSYVRYLDSYGHTTTKTGDVISRSRYEVAHSHW